MDRMPPNPAYQPLTLTQIEYLTDQIVMAYHDPSIAEALLVLMDEIERLALSEPLDVEPVTVRVKHHAYYRLNDTENNQQALITALRGALAQRFLSDRAND